jgi:predicted Zn-dependent peptidase
MQLKLEQRQLKSGLTVILSPLKTDSVSCLFLVRAGSRDETQNQFGAAHFLEHFVFKGTKKYPKVNDVTKAVDRLGGKQNAFTWTDFTGYWVKLASDHIETATDVVSEMVANPLLPDKELAKEKGTILEEIHMGEDHLPTKAWRGFENLVFPDSPLGRPILGTKESIMAMKTEDLKSFWSTWYQPENAIVVVSGGISDLKKTGELIEEKFAPLGGKSETQQRVGYNQVFTQEGPRVSLTHKKSEQAHLVLGMRALSANDSRLETLWVMETILGGNMSSRLWNEIREKRGLAYYIGSGFDARIDQGSFYVRAGVRIKEAGEAVKVIVEQLELMADKGISSEELEMGQEAVKGNLKLDLEDSIELAQHLADHWATTGGKIKLPAETIKQVDAVTRDGVKQLAREVLERKLLNLSLVGPFKEEAKYLKALGA